MTRPTQEEVAKFKMPTIELGAPVVWYASGERSKIGAEIGFVMHCGPRTVTLYTARGRRMDAVRHVDDPKLRLSVEQRESGAWDYAPTHVRIMDIERRLTELESRLPRKTPAIQPKKDGRGSAGRKNLEAFARVRAEAKSLGIAIKNRKKADIEADIKRVKLERGIITPSVTDEIPRYTPELAEIASEIQPPSNITIEDD